MYLRVVCLVDWHLEVFYCPYYKIKNARMHELNFMHPNIYYRTKIDKKCFHQQPIDRGKLYFLLLKITIHTENKLCISYGFPHCKNIEKKGFFIFSTYRKYL